MTTNLDLTKTIVVKIGGSTLGQHDTTLEDLVALQKRAVPLVVVHGGGKAITQWLERQGIPSRFVAGLRVTDAESLEVVMAVLAGLVNKELVAAIAALGGRAIGISGLDGGLIEARVKDAALGFVGEVIGVRTGPLQAILANDYMAVVAPLGLDDEGHGPLNINADTVAGAIAAALPAQRLAFLTDVAGVGGQDGKVLPYLSSEQAASLMASGVISGGMIPKVEACLAAANCGVAGVIVDGRQPHALKGALKNEGMGTVVKGGAS
ncbi:MAG: acetylglutamate kinase [Chloroflexi bacterium]|nr:acetylglutamate kinase [Chloroflexota bacterium]